MLMHPLDVTGCQLPYDHSPQLILPDQKLDSILPDYPVDGSPAAPVHAHSVRTEGDLDIGIDVLSELRYGTDGNDREAFDDWDVGGF